ncbi:MAG: phosphatase PAP2 family protein [Blastocatellia bacterium]|nr:phosphatase PAP2 family protein [Blastocatellia bacterium]
MKILKLTRGIWLAICLLGLVWSNPALAPAQEKTASSQTAASLYLAVTEADLKKLLPPPPVDASKQHQSEVAVMLDLQAKRTPAQEKEAQAQDKLSLTVFADVLGKDFDAQHFPKTDAFLTRLIQNAGPVTEMGKELWKRPRPFVTYGQIQPCLRRSQSNSYPSGHATIAQLWARTLAEVFPKQRAAILRKGDQIALNRVIAGVHYPSDIAAGKKLGEFLFTQARKNPAFLADLKQVKEECQKKD